MVGSTLALLLAQQRLRVALCVQPPRPATAATTTASPGPEPGPDGHSDIRAYALNTASRQLLESVRAWPEEGLLPERQPPVTPVERMEVQGDQGGALTFSALTSGTPALNWMVDVPALEARLAGESLDVTLPGRGEIRGGADGSRAGRPRRVRGGGAGPR